MDTNALSRKEFIVLTFTLIGSATASCSGDGGGGGTGSGGMGGSGGPVICDDPLNVRQNTDSTGHTHTLSVPASALQATTPQMFTTSTSGAHTHSVSLSASQLTTIRNGSFVNVNSSSDNNHMHVYRVACQA